MEFPQSVQEQLLEIKAQIIKAENINPNFYEDGSKILELCNRLPLLYEQADHTGRAKILKLLASNYTINDVSITPTYRKPFDLLAKGLSCSTKLPREDSNLGQAG